MTLTKRLRARVVQPLRSRRILLVTFIEAWRFLKRNPEIFANREILVAWHCSFGHPILGIDWTARLYYPNRISMIYIDHPRANPYVPLCYQHTMDVFNFKGSIAPLPGAKDEVRYTAVRAATMLMTALKGQPHNIISLFQAYRTVGLSDGHLKIGTVKGVRPYNDVTGIDRLIRAGVGRPPSLPQALEHKCRDAITARYPDFFARPLAVLSLRDKEKAKALSGDRDVQLRDREELRDSGPQPTYRAAVQRLSAAGYNVLGMGETDSAVFSDIPNFYSFDEIDAPGPLLNVFALIQCAILICGHSGPSIMVESVGGRVIIANGYPLTSGAHRIETIFLQKRVFDKELQRLLTFREIYEGPQPLAFSVHMQPDRYEIVDNTSEEIDFATAQTIAELNGTLQLSSIDRALQAAFQTLPSREMSLSFQKNCPPIQLLRRESNSLLSPPEPHSSVEAVAKFTQLHKTLHHG